MLSNKTLVLFGLVGVLPVLISIPISIMIGQVGIALYVFVFLIPIPIFSGAVMGLSFLNKSNRFTYGIALIITVPFPSFIHIYGMLYGLTS